MSTFKSMRGSVDRVDADTRASVVEHTQSLHERRDAGEDVTIVPAYVWLQTLADLQWALKVKAL